MARHRPYRLTANGKRQPSGRVFADGKAVRDDQGLFFPLSASFFWWWWGWKQDRARAEQNLATIAPWCDEIRAFGEVGGPSWEDRTIDPRAAEYEDIAKAASDAAFGVHEVRTQLTIFAGGTGADPDQTLSKVKRILRGRLEAFSSVEISNEGHGVEDRAVRRRLAQELQAEFPGLLVATTNGTDADWSPAGFDLDVASMGTQHSDRGRGDDDWRQVRQGCELMGFPKVTDNNEPPGFESSVATLHDPLRLASLRLVGLLCGSARYCHHTGAGVRGGGKADQERGRAANFWEYDGFGCRPSMAEAVAAYRVCEALVPADAPNWRGVKGHWADTRLAADMIWSDDPVQFDHGCVRVYGCYRDHAYAEMVIGVRRFVELTQKAGAYQVQAFDVLTGERVIDQAVGDGGRFRLEGDPHVWGSAPNQAGSSKAYLVLGTR